METENDSRFRYASAVLPWILGGALAVLYAVTLNHWITVASLPSVSGITGWDTSPQLSAPLYYLVTYPLRWLPAAAQPVGLNFFAAICAALTVGMLVRSVALLPHDRTREQRQRERSEDSLLSGPLAWLPPVFAGLVCGLQLTFWENATAATGEMFDLLLFAYLARCLLEYRLTRRPSWLWRLAFIYGLAVPENPAMIAYFPCFLVALIWIQGRGFFQANSLLGMLGLGLAGLLLYLMLPALCHLTQSSTASFGEMLRFELSTQKAFILGFPRSRVLILALTSLLPALLIGIRWPGSLGDTSVAGALLANFMSRVVHAMFLGACLYVAFDPKFSPRSLGYGLAFLPLYYLGALSIGYFSGYFLLTCSKPAGKIWRRPNPAVKFVNGLLLAVIILAGFGCPAALAYKNYSAIRATNSSVLRDFADLMVRSLPQRPAVVLSDNPYLNLLLEAGQATNSAMARHVVIDVRTMPFHAYQTQLLKRAPSLMPTGWAELLKQQGVTDPISQDLNGELVRHFARQMEVYYLSPSFGGLFEYMYLRPHGLVYQLRDYGTNTAPPALTAEEVAQNDRFWTDAEPIMREIPRLIMRKNTEAILTGSWYGRALNFWGVERQRAGRLEDAGKWFKLAQAIDADNYTAVINAGFNADLRNHRASTIDLRVVDGVYAANHTWEARLATFGPVDEPNLCFEVGRAFANGALYRQAMLQFRRVAELDPENLQARLWLANMYLLGRMPDQVLTIVDEIRGPNAARGLQPATAVELTRLEALAHFGKAAPGVAADPQFMLAEKILLAAEAKYPGDENLLSTLTQIYLLSHHLTNALATLDKQLSIGPDNVRALLNQGAIYIELKDYDKAIVPLNRVLKLQPENRAALMNRAISYLQSRKFSEAERDYAELAKAMPGMHSIYFGLAEIAAERHDRATAIKNYELYMQYAPPDQVVIDFAAKKVAWRYPAEKANVEKALRELQGGTK